MQRKTIPQLVLSLFVLASVAVAAPAQSGEPTPFHDTSVTQSWMLEDLIAAGPQTGGVVITEFMKDPSAVVDTRGEWIELYNNLPWRVNLEGMVVADDAGSQVVLQNGGAGIRLAPGQYYVIGNNGDPALNGGVTVNYVYSGFVLGNGADQIELRRPSGLVVDRVDYDDGVAWPDDAGRSVSLTGAIRDATMNDDGSLWCSSTTHWNASSTDTGTPGAANDICP